jgi:hypothetical protein
MRRPLRVLPRGQNPSPPFRGEREGPVACEPSAHGLDPWGREGEVGYAVNRLGSPLTLPSPLGRWGERVKGASRMLASFLASLWHLAETGLALAEIGQGG